jgi:hypothetical protein
MNPGIADLAAFWDFDFSDESLVPMRLWLRERLQHTGLRSQPAMGNQLQQLGLRHAHDHERGHEAAHGDNYSAPGPTSKSGWTSLTRRPQDGVDARSADPDAYAGIAGGQMPGWGG